MNLVARIKRLAPYDNFGRILVGTAFALLFVAGFANAQTQPAEASAFSTTTMQVTSSGSDQRLYCAGIDQVMTPHMAIIANCGKWPMLVTYNDEELRLQPGQRELIVADDDLEVSLIGDGTVFGAFNLGF